MTELFPLVHFCVKCVSDDILTRFSFVTLAPLQTEIPSLHLNDPQLYKWYPASALTDLKTVFLN